LITRLPGWLVNYRERGDDGSVKEGADAKQCNERNSNVADQGEMQKMREIAGRAMWAKYCPKGVSVWKLIEKWVESIWGRNASRQGCVVVTQTGASFGKNYRGAQADNACHDLEQSRGNNDNSLRPYGAATQPK